MISGFELPQSNNFGEALTRARQWNRDAGANAGAAFLGMKGEREANKIMADAYAYGGNSGGGFNWNDLLGGVAGIAGKAFGGGGGGMSFGQSFTSSNFKMPSYMDGASNFSSFFNP